MYNHLILCIFYIYSIIYTWHLLFAEYSCPSETSGSVQHQPQSVVLDISPIPTRGTASNLYYQSVPPVGVSGYRLYTPLGPPTAQEYERMYLVGRQNPNHDQEYPVHPYHMAYNRPSLVQDERAGSYLRNYEQLPLVPSLANHCVQNLEKLSYQRNMGRSLHTGAQLFHSQHHPISKHRPHRHSRPSRHKNSTHSKVKGARTVPAKPQMEYSSSDSERDYAKCTSSQSARLYEYAGSHCDADVSGFSTGVSGPDSDSVLDNSMDLSCQDISNSSIFGSSDAPADLSGSEQGEQERSPNAVSPLLPPVTLQPTCVQNRRSAKHGHHPYNKARFYSNLPSSVIPNVDCREKDLLSKVVPVASSCSKPKPWKTPTQSNLVISSSAGGAAGSETSLSSVSTAGMSPFVSDWASGSGSDTNKAKMEHCSYCGCQTSLGQVAVPAMSAQPTRESCSLAGLSPLVLRPNLPVRPSCALTSSWCPSDRSASVSIPPMFGLDSRFPDQPLSCCDNSTLAAQTEQQPRLLRSNEPLSKDSRQLPPPSYHVLPLPSWHRHGNLQASSHLYVADCELCASNMDWYSEAHCETLPAIVLENEAPGPSVGRPCALADRPSPSEGSPSDPEASPKRFVLKRDKYNLVH